MKLNTLNDLYVHELKDLYSAEKQILKALPQMAKAATSAELKQAFVDHLEETKIHITRLEEVLEMAGAGTRGPKCKGMEGLLEEGKGMIEEEADAEVRDAGLIAAAQRVEHYEMAGYGCVRTYAKLLGHKQASKILQTTLDEEGNADKKLTQLAESVINLKANE
jgi:ferritin-like metal-binding protein YciE